ncbi:MAG: fumarylacetoacetate hydrolase family protein, partial [Oscillochloris sp.]|nr:fumarylacetoacetate hydrolase family protein [Oscillochloris sp.]
ELEIYADDDGRLSLTMVARVNGIERSRGNAASIYYSFADLIAHASRDATLYPGDVLGSGTVGTGCLLELTRGYGPWLSRGDVVELEITELGVLRNTIE